MPPKSAEALARKNEQRLELYYQRKADGDCVDCGVELPEDAESVQCDACRAKKRDASAKWRQTEEGRKTVRACERAMYQRRSLANAAGEAVCVKCGLKPEAGKRYCKACRALNTAAVRTYREKKRREAAGIIPITRRRHYHRHVPPLGDRFRPAEGEPSTRDRILRALRFFDWTPAAELFDAIGVDDAKKERDRFAAALSRLARVVGAIDRRDVAGVGEYRINARGRALLAERAA